TVAAMKNDYGRKWTGPIGFDEVAFQWDTRRNHKSFPCFLRLLLLKLRRLERCALKSDIFARFGMSRQHRVRALDQERETSKAQGPLGAASWHVERTSSVRDGVHSSILQLPPHELSTGDNPVATSWMESTNAHPRRRKMLRNGRISSHCSAPNI